MKFYLFIVEFVKVNEIFIGVFCFSNKKKINISKTATDLFYWISYFFCWWSTLCDMF